MLKTEVWESPDISQTYSKSYAREYVLSLFIPHAPRASFTALPLIVVELWKMLINSP